MKEILGKRVEKTLHEAIELADLGDRRISARKIAERVFESEPDLVEEAKRPTIVDRWTWMVTRMRRERWDGMAPSRQMVLDDPIFKNLPETVFLRNGTRPKLDQCLLSETEDHLKLLQERLKKHPRVKQFEAVVELHRKWAATRRGVTWGDAKKLEAEEREKNRASE